MRGGVLFKLIALRAPVDKTEVALVIVAFVALVSAAADDLTGQASIIDGGTPEIHGTRMRPWGMDAPESSQLCRGGAWRRSQVSQKLADCSGCHPKP